MQEWIDETNLKNMTLDFSIFNLGRKYIDPSDKPLDINGIQGISSENPKDELGSLVDENFSNEFDELSNYVFFARWDLPPEL